MKQPTVAIIQFPGSNCEYETQKAAEKAGFKATIVRWNHPLDNAAQFDAYILPGGFSYQDRIRAGVISAKLPIMAVIESAAAQKKPILGICNGCQILAETGLIPDTNGTQAIELSMARNASQDQAVGFICDWVYIKVKNPENSLFTQGLSENDVIPIPVNHGEGRFLFSDASQTQSLTTFTYCDANGKTASEFPANPNGSPNSIAGICNPAGNVLGIMPHPERAYLKKQLPSWLPDPLLKKWTDDGGPCLPLFKSMALSITKGSYANVS